MGHMGYGASLPPSSIFESEMTTPNQDNPGEQGSDQDAASRRKTDEKSEDNTHAADDSWDPPSFVNYFIRPSDSEYESTPVDRTNEAQIGGRQTVNDLRAMLDGNQEGAMMYRPDPQEMHTRSVDQADTHTSVIHPARTHDTISSTVQVPVGPRRTRTPRIRVTEVEETALTTAARYIDQPDELPYSTDASENAQVLGSMDEHGAQQRRRNAGTSSDEPAEANDPERNEAGVRHVDTQ